MELLGCSKLSTCLCVLLNWALHILMQHLEILLQMGLIFWLLLTLVVFGACSKAGVWKVWFCGHGWMERPLGSGGHSSRQQEDKQGLIQPQFPSYCFAHCHCHDSNNLVANPTTTLCRTCSHCCMPCVPCQSWSHCFVTGCELELHCLPHVGARPAAVAWPGLDPGCKKSCGLDLA